MTDREIALKEVAIGFAEFLDDDCIRGFKGWFLRDLLTQHDKIEFDLDELYDYWVNTILNK